MVHLSLLELIRDIDMTPNYNWCSLAFIIVYHNLCKVTSEKSKVEENSKTWLFLHVLNIIFFLWRFGFKDSSFHIDLILILFLVRQSSMSLMPCNAMITNMTSPSIVTFFKFKLFVISRVWIAASISEQKVFLLLKWLTQAPIMIPLSFWRTTLDFAVFPSR